MTSTLRWDEWKVAHGPTTCPPLWLSEAVFITDQAYDAGAKLEFLVSTYCRACRPYFLADFHQTQNILRRMTSTLWWFQWNVAHGPTTWPPLWLSDSIPSLFIECLCRLLSYVTVRLVARPSSLRTEHIMLVQSWNSAHYKQLFNNWARLPGHILLYVHVAATT